MKQLFTFFSFARDVQLLVSLSILSIFYFKRYMTFSLTLYSVIFLLFFSKDTQLEKFAIQLNVSFFQLLIFYSFVKNTQLDNFFTQIKTNKAIVSLSPSGSLPFHHLFILKNTQLDKVDYPN